MERVRVRVLTDRYLELRKRYRAGRPPPLLEERSGLLRGDELQEMSPAGGQLGSTAPPWARLLEEMNLVLAQIRQKLEQDLRPLHVRSALPSFSASGADTDAQVEECGREISQMFVSLSNGMRRLLQLQKSATDDDDAQTLRNVQSTMALQISDVQRAYREMQRKYVEKLEARRRKSNAHLSSSKEAQKWDEKEQTAGWEEWDASGGAGGARQEAQLDTQHSTIDIIRQEIAEREHCVSEVSRQLADVQTLFMEFDDKLVEQGTMLDRIDTQLESTHTHVVKAVGELRQAEKRQKRSTFTILVLLLCILILIFAACVVLKAL